jgi:acyl carrier protein
MSLPQSVVAVFREVFDDPSLDVTPETDASGVDDWDSLNHIHLIVALEERFSIQFTTREIGSMICVGDLHEMLKARGVEP